MKISIVIPAYNEEKLLPRTLAHVREATGAFAARRWDSEVIVCDNNSSDRTAEVARAGGARVVFEPVNQIARARNAGAAAATGNWLVFVDADSAPSAALFEDVAREIEGGRTVAGGATVRLDETRLAAMPFVQGWNNLSRIMRWMAGSFIFVETAAFQAIGGFDAELFVSEEIDLSQRLGKYARAKRRRVVILSRHPLMTSSRKIHLYTAREHVGFMVRTLFQWGGTLRRREACAIWYDGRR